MKCTDQDSSKMDKQPKRRVLSLSLSQPGKQNRRLKLKRHASAASQNDSKVFPSEDWQDVNNTRDSLEMNVSENRSNIIASKTSDDQLAIKSLFPDSNETSFALTTVEQEKKSVSVDKLKSADCLKEQNVSFDCARANITTRSGRKAPLPDKPTSSATEEDCDFDDFVKPPCIKKKAVNVAHKETSGGSHSNATSGNKPNERGGIALPTLCSRGLDPTLAVKEAIPSEEMRTPACVPSPSLDIPVPDKPSESAAVLKDDECFEILQCPLCCKMFDKLSSKTSHLKSCASKHKVSTQQLLEALELQQRQASERRALGLPPISPSVEKVKKPHTSRKETRTISKVDNNLQLALALSLSLQDAEQGVGESTTREPTVGVSLDHFGFTSKSVLNAVQPRPTTVPLPKGKSKATALKTPALLTRTPEERQRIITEKVAMVLMEEVASGEEKDLQEVNVKSLFLQECVDVERALWAKSHTSPSKNDRTSYYVQNLRSFISPSKVEMGSKVMHLSQVVGRLHTPTKDKKQHKEEDLDPNCPTDEEVSSDTSSPSHQQNELKDPTQIEMELRAKLFNDWASMVNNATMSDLAIYPQEGREIPAHKMVLHVRCPRILKDICRQRNPLTGNEVEVIMWSKTPHAAALAFLEYVYCGSVKSIRVLCDDLSSISWLADHYKVADLLRYLRSVSQSGLISQTSSQFALNVIKDFSEDCPTHVCESEKESVLPVLNENVGLRKLSKASVDIVLSPAGTPNRSDTDSIYSEATVQGADNRSTCSSPDMFADDETDHITHDGSKRHSMANAMDSANVNAERHSLAKTLSCNDGDGVRPPSRCASVSSEQTLIAERTSPPVSRCSSAASSEKTIIICTNSPPPSPAISNTSASTELLDFNQSGGTSRPGSSLNDSKRKHSNSSQDGNSSLCKRPCPESSTAEHQAEKEDSDVEIFDLTQDSNSSTSFPIIQNQFSGNSCDNSNMPAESNISDGETIIKSPEHVKGISNEESDCSDGNDEGSKVNGTNNGNCHEDEKPSDCDADVAYVSPVWEGFEDLNYDDPFLNEPHFDIGSPNTTPVTTPRAVETDSRSESKSPLKVASSSEEKCSDVDIQGSSDCEITYSSPTSTVISKHSKPSTSDFNALLDDSLNMNDSVLLQAEKGVAGKLTQRETKGTPVNRILSSEPDGVTPLANYSAMKTPELKKELQKYGLKPTLGKRKGKIMLRHIYNELHPWVPLETNQSLPDRISLSQPTCSSSIENKIVSSNEPNSRRLSFSDSDSIEKNTIAFDKDCRNSATDSDSESNYSNRSVSTSLQEIQFMEGNDDNGDDDDCEPKSQTASKRVSKSDLPRIVTNFIRNDRELHQKVLEYEPIRIEQLQTDLLTKGFKCGIEALMTFLDERCITFRSESSGPRVRKKKAKSAMGKKTAGHSQTCDLDSD
ncbi:uncharacterized protein LOC117654406 [Thrips palmi]|uniref:Structure-specific endonuclease subunit SLX4 n=1 Tax=Thrips palmi TaxID=161013 RepID=A0A6P9AHJ6_THRPL|nr:uncharacterized protein LOC117654406 [Thrips palmi]